MRNISSLIIVFVVGAQCAFAAPLTLESSLQGTTSGELNAKNLARNSKVVQIGSDILIGSAASKYATTTALSRAGVLEIIPSNLVGVLNPISATVPYVLQAQPPIYTSTLSSPVVEHGHRGESLLLYDLNADGLDDLIVASPEASSVTAYARNAGATLSFQNNFLWSIKLFDFYNNPRGLGKSLTRCGNYLFIGATSAEDENGSYYPGAVFRFPISALTNLPAATQFNALTSADKIYYPYKVDNNPNNDLDPGEYDLSHFGESIKCLDNGNATFAPTIVISAPQFSPNYTVALELNRGAVFIYDGAGNRQYFEQGAEQGEYLGKAVEVVEVDGNLATKELTIGKPGADFSVDYGYTTPSPSVSAQVGEVSIIALSLNQATGIYSSTVLSNIGPQIAISGTSNIDTTTQGSGNGVSLLAINNSAGQLQSLMVGSPGASLAKGSVQSYSFNSTGSSFSSFLNSNQANDKFGLNLNMLSPVGGIEKFAVSSLGLSSCSNTACTWNSSGKVTKLSYDATQPAATSFGYMAGQQAAGLTQPTINGGLVFTNGIATAYSFNIMADSSALLLGFIGAPAGTPQPIGLALDPFNTALTFPLVLAQDSSSSYTGTWTFPAWLQGLSLCYPLYAQVISIPYSFFGSLNLGLIATSSAIAVPLPSGGCA